MNIHNITDPFPITAKSLYKIENANCNSNLWCYVLRRAVWDLYLKPNHKYNSLNWCLSSSDKVGSMIWICLELDIDRQAVIETHATRIRTLLLTR